MAGSIQQLLAAYGSSETSVLWNSADKSANITLSGGNLVAIATGAGAVRAVTSRSSGKKYFEILCGGTSFSGAGQAAMNASASLATYPGGAANGAGIFNITNVVAGWTQAQAGTFALAAGDYLMFAVNFTLGYMWVGKNGSWQLTGDPAAGTNPWVTGIAEPIFPAYGATGSSTQNATLRTTTSSFGTAPPSGFTSWATP